MRTLHLLAATGLALLTAGCSDAVGPTPRTQVAVAFSTSSGPAAAAAPGPARSVAIEGDDGMLVLDELFVIVAEFELDRLDDDGCAEDDDACETFRSPPAFLDLPLDGGTVVAVTLDVEPGVYDELEFEIEDLDDDEEDPVEAAQIAALMQQIRARFPEWPRKASMLAVGSFTRTGESPRPFRVFFEAEVELELDLVPPAVIGDGASTFTVELDPTRWFRDGRGRVLDLSRFDFDTTGRLVELEVEVEEGIIRVEVDTD